MDSIITRLWHQSMPGYYFKISESNLFNYQSGKQICSRIINFVLLLVKEGMNYLPAINLNFLTADAIL